MALEGRKYHQSSQNRKLHRTVSLDFFRKKLPFPLCIHFTNIINLVRSSEAVRMIKPAVAKDVSKGTSEPSQMGT